MSDELKDGQIYRWRWADKARDADSAPYRSYHCKSQIAVVSKGRLIDTFWSDMSSDRAVNRGEVVLTFLCDQSWRIIRPYEIPYYDLADIADTRHSNHSDAPVYLRPDAKRSETRIIQEIAYREEKANSEIRSAQWALERLAGERAKVAAGKLNDVSL